MKRNMLFFGLLLMILQTQAAQYWHFPFDERSAQLQDHGPHKLSGRYIPSDNPDNDTPETTDPERYRPKGKNGRALQFFSDLKSAAEITDFKLPVPTRSLYMQFYIKCKPTRVATILGCKWDTGKNGFILFLANGRWMFHYGDGLRTHKITFKGSTLSASQWIPISLYFNEGKVTLWENGKKLGTKQGDGPIIAPNTAPLVIGNFQRGFRHVYPFNGALDDLCIADHPETALKQLGQQQSAPSPKIDVLVEPVDGNEKHFGNIKTLHIFSGYPASVTFRFRSLSEHLKGKMEERIRTNLSLRVPAEVTIAEAFTQSWKPRRLLKLKTINIKLDNKDYTEYRLPQDESGLITMRNKFGREDLTLVLRTSQDFKRGQVFWQTDHTEPATFELKALAPPTLKPLPPGQFSVMGYISPIENLYTEKENLRQFGELYANAGFLGFGRSCNYLTIRAQAERFLQEQFGFQLYEVNLWGGPQKQRTLMEVPAAVNSKGNIVQTQYCPYAMTQSPKLLKTFVDRLRESIPAQGTRAVILDYEPWHAPQRICYCQTCLNRFKKRFSLPETTVTPELIAQKYRRQWGCFWTEHTHAIISFLTQAAKDLLPGVPVWEYTYLFDYDAPNLEDRFWTIPKDPRQLENLVDCSMLSLYHVQGTNLIKQVDISRKHLKKELSGIIYLTRSNATQGLYTAPQESHSPRQIAQKLILLGALGITTAGIFPGTFIDQAFLPEIERAVRLVRTHETFLLKGKRVDQNVQLPKPAYCIAWEYQRKILMVIFNFSGQDRSLQPVWLGKPLEHVPVAAWDVAFIPFTPNGENNANHKLLK